jgi:DNA-binding response OmpR family regulator
MNKILIIEDDIRIQDVYETQFRSAGFEVIKAFTGSEGIKLVKEHKPDIVLLDIVLPGEMSGFNVFEMMMVDSELSKIPVIVITNLENQKDAPMLLGAKDYIIKSKTSIDDVLKRVNKWITKEAKQ